MFNTPIILKMLGALLGAVLFLLLVIRVSGLVYQVDKDQDGFGKDRQMAGTGRIMSDRPGDLLPAGDDDREAEAGNAAEVAIVPGHGDATAGARVFKQCKACHSVESRNGIGPHLNGVVGRPVASVDGFGYSAALKAHGGAWTLEALDAWLADPRGYIPGSRMYFVGLKNPEDRNNVIAYLQENSRQATHPHDFTAPGS